MNKRPKIPDALAADVLFKSRRRCCLCVFLRSQHGVKKGQIAHLNRRPDDNRPDNLAFLCLDHHDEYDSPTSVSKGLNAKEIKRYRDLLYAKNDSRDVEKRKSRTKTSANKKTDTRIEPFFWLAQTLVGWTTSGMELSWDVFLQQANQLKVDVPDRAEVPRDDYLAEAAGPLTEDLIDKHGQISADIFFIGTMVALLPYMFDSPDQLRTTKAAIERTVLTAFESAKALEVTTLFLNEVPCEIPTFVESIEEYKQQLQQAVAV